MHQVLEYFLIAFPAIFVILNPLMGASTFMSMTGDFSPQEQNITARKACLTAFICLVVFAAFGHLIFQFFQITVEAFRIAGGLILFLVGLQMLNLQPLRIKQTEEEREEMLKKSGHDIGIIPLGIPIMCGPGSITTAIVLMGEVKWASPVIGLMQVAGLIFSFALSLFIFYLILINSRKLTALLTKTGIGVITRIMGLILTVIATQFVINGVRDILS